MAVHKLNKYKVGKNLDLERLKPGFAQVVVAERFEGQTEVGEGVIGVIIGHDPLLQFGGRLDVAVVLVVEVGDAILDRSADIDGLLREFELRLEDVGALLDDRLAPVEPSLLGCWVQREDGIVGACYELLSVAEMKK